MKMIINNPMHKCLDGIDIMVIPDNLSQRRKHRKKRINKKWAKRYGYYRSAWTSILKDGEVYLVNENHGFDKKLYMNKSTYLKLKNSIEMKEKLKNEFGL